MTSLDQRESSRADPVLLIDIGGSKLAMAVALSGVITERVRIDGMDRIETPDQLVQTIAREADRIGWTGGRAESGLIVAAVPGVIDRSGQTVVGAANLPLGGFPLALELSRHLKSQRVVLEDDANCGVVGEHRHGVARGCDDAAYLSLSTGVGMGIIANGALVRGTSRSAGEVGHMLIRPGGRACGCGRSGCLEAYFSGRALARAGEEALRNGYGHGLRDRAGSLTGRDVVEAAYGGDAVLHTLIRDSIAHLVVAVQAVCAVLDPAIVVIGGGLTKHVTFAADVLAALRQQVGSDTVAFELAALGDDSVLIGALELVAPDERLVGR